MLTYYKSICYGILKFMSLPLKKYSESFLYKVSIFSNNVVLIQKKRLEFRNFFFKITNSTKQIHNYTDNKLFTHSFFVTFHKGILI